MSTAYGDHPSQIVHRHPPRRSDGPAPVAVLLHGGWWRDLHDAHLMDPLAEDLTAAGWAVWNVEYRRTGVDGGGWPQTVDDVARALDLLAVTADREDGLDASRVVAIGHSAGGHLALMTAADSLVTAVVALAPITDLRRCAEAGLGEGAVGPFLGPDPTAALYAEASPLHRLPIGVPQLVVHGDADQRVPVEQSRDYIAAARSAGDDVDHREIAGADHFAVVDPAHAAWRTVRDALGTGRF
ncbi:S9 family peptidase [Nocardiopsis sp. MG754419]|uniref:alpha/beta hydrolase family protein n=1 Tax=Nocardiopsis sp. MG754419 TaxID=2259865 RepID=UPI001BA56A61|nr:alpha/beta fold hydrolase [Nocardiopsis sp. MG754419]MBR8740273.1 alpha/beta hydrolase [Nocardiopsis sp. MG754419]